MFILTSGGLLFMFKRRNQFMYLKIIKNFSTEGCKTILCFYSDDYSESDNLLLGLNMVHYNVGIKAL